MAEQSQEQEHELMKESHHRRDELHHLTCLTQIKTDEKEQKSHELVTAEVPSHLVFQSSYYYGSDMKSTHCTHCANA